MKRSLKKKVKEIIRAVKGKPKDTIEVGVDVKSCMNCKYKKFYKEVNKDENNA